MKRIRIKIVFLGFLPHTIDIEKIKSWKSNLFEIVDSINTIAIVGNSDGHNWEYSDENMEKQIPVRSDSDILLAVTNVPIQNNFFARRFEDNRICLTYCEMTDILKSENIPMENLILRVLYSVSLLYRRYENRIPNSHEHTNFAHDDTRGCLFDMNGIKTDIIYSLDKPHLCHSCVESLTTNSNFRFEVEVIDRVQKELRGIRKRPYYRITDFIKKNPVLSIIISAFSAFVIGTMGSLVSNIIWRLLKIQ